MRRAIWAALVVVWVWVIVGASAVGAAAPPGNPAVASTGAALPGVALVSYDASIGKPIVLDRLTVFPIYAVSDPKLDDAISLELALERDKARVRELGSEGGEDAGRVGTLVIDNLGKAPIVALAGTVVKGGKQDRQIAQDFVIAAGKTVDVDAFCVEHGRWSGERDGKRTGGKFTASGMIAPTEVRVAGQHEGDQSKVWDKVAKTNAASKKTSASGTLMATYDDPKLVTDRRALAKTIAEKLDGSTQPESILGVAYAIDGRVRGVRWFGNRKLYEGHKDKILQAAAVETILAGDAPTDPPKAVTAKVVRDFVEGVAKREIKASKKSKNALNRNDYKESDEAYAAEARLEQGGAKARPPVTVDISAK